MINLNSIDISKWFKFPEVLITIGVILLIISIILIIIAYLTTDKETDKIDNDGVEEEILPKTAKTKQKSASKNIDAKEENITKTDNKKNKKEINKEIIIAKEDDEEEIELL